LAGSSLYLDGTGGNAGYLKNEDHIELPSGSVGSISTAIAVSGTDVYVAGIGITGNVYNSPQNHIAKYWKNGSAINLTDGTHFAEAWSIAVSGNDAYVAGMEWNGRSYQDANGYPNKKSVAKYWKNSQPVILSDGTNDAWTTSIAVSGNDVYVAGMEWNGKSYQDASGSTYKKSVAKYWKNSQPVILTDGTEDAYAESIAVSSTDVYVAGTEWNGKPYQIQGNAYIYRKSIAKYWKNGQAINLTDGTEDAVAKSIAISGTDVYVAGTVNGYATYWKNGVAVKLSNVESDANSIFLVKH